MFNFVAQVFGYVLNFIYNLVHNYGLAIIIFTIISRIILLPISLKQQKTMKKTQIIQKEMKSIQERYSNDPERMNRETMELYKSHNMTPFSGCLGSILQFILLIGMFILISRPLTHMLHVDSAKLDEYKNKLHEETEQVRYEEIEVIKRFGPEDDEVNLNMDFLGLNLASVPTSDYKDVKVFIIPALYVITSIVSMKLNTAMNKEKQEEETEEEKKKKKLSKEEKDEINSKKIKEKVSDEEVVAELKEIQEQQEKEDEEADAMEEMNKQMSLMMPIMSVSIAMIAPLGLALYWLVSNISMILERLAVNKFFKQEEEK